MAEFLAYVRALRRDVAAFKAATGLRVEDAAALVPCGFSAHHFVPPEALEAHARKCHRAKYYESHASHQFFYQNATLTAANAELNGEDDGSASLVEARADGSNGAHAAGVEESVRALAPDAPTFYASVQRWRRVPHALARLATADGQGLMVSRDKLRRWVASELKRVLEEAEEADAELVEYVLGLVEHPEFCHPDLVAVELQEFLGGANARSFVLALWKFMAVEIGRRMLPSAAEVSVDVAHSKGEDKAEKERLKEKEQPSAARDYRRRRPSYRAKATRAGPYEVMREVLERSMAQLSEETGREIVGGVPTAPSRELKVDAVSQTRKVIEEKEWRACRDALRVRDMSRPGRVGGQDERPRDRSRERTRSQSKVRRSARERGRSRSRSRRRNRDREHHWRDRSRDRREGRDRSRDRDRDRRH